MNRENGVCKVCYALKGNYRFRNVKEAQEWRYRLVRACFEAGSGSFAFLVNKALEGSKNTYFRVHDSGDMFSPDYAHEWILISKANPGIHFWIPTRTWIVEEILPALLELNRMKNVTVRPSALAIGDDAPKVNGLAAGSTVSRDPSKVSCPAYLQDGKCGKCRKCWKGSKSVTFKAH